MELISGLEVGAGPPTPTACCWNWWPNHALEEIAVYRRWWSDRRGWTGCCSATCAPMTSDRRARGAAVCPPSWSAHPTASGDLRLQSGPTTALCHWWRRSNTSPRSATAPHRPGQRPVLPPRPHRCCAVRRSARSSAGDSGWMTPLPRSPPTTPARAVPGRPGWLLSAPPTRPTALLYDNDIMAIAGLSVAQQMGLVGAGLDLSIIAWDDSPICRLVHPPLTALSRDIQAFGAAAARHLLAGDRRARRPADVETTRGELTPRGSTGRPRPLPLSGDAGSPLDT